MGGETTNERTAGAHALEMWHIKEQLALCRETSRYNQRLVNALGIYRLSLFRETTTCGFTLFTVICAFRWIDFEGFGGFLELSRISAF